MSKVIRVEAVSSLATEAVNVYHWRIPGAGSQSAEIASAISALDTFYEAIKGFLSAGTITVGTRVVTVDQTPNQELPSSSLGTTTTGGAPAVLSACVVASMRGSAIGPRYRGRVYLGPLDADMITSSGATLESSSISSISSAWATLVGTSANSIELGIWSRAHNTFTPAVASSVTTAVGTQRRRLR